MTDKTGLEVVAYLYQHEETGRTGFVDQTQISFGWEQGNPRLKVIAPLVTLASAQAAVAAAVDEESKRLGALINIARVERDAAYQRITALEFGARVARDAITSLEGVGHVIAWKGEWELCNEAVAIIDTTLGAKAWQQAGTTDFAKTTTNASVRGSLKGLAQRGNCERCGERLMSDMTTICYQCNQE